MPLVKFMPTGQEVNTDDGTSVLDAALDNDIDLDHNCGGNCVCSTCHIIVEEGFEKTNPISEDEAEMLEDADNATETSRLACQCLVSTDLIITIPEPV